MATFDARIKLKSDTEANWLLVESTFRPLPGELIIYLPDSEHHYNHCRVKIGNEQRDTLHDLPFIDAGTINGKEVEIVKLESINRRPSPGSPDKLYVDVSTNTIYHYDEINGYTQLSNFTYNMSKINVAQFNSWSAGSMTTATVENNILKIVNGSAPALSYQGATAVANITKVPNTI